MLIQFEGTESSGKTSVINAVYHYIKNSDLTCDLKVRHRPDNQTVFGMYANDILNGNFENLKGDRSFIISLLCMLDAHCFPSEPDKVTLQSRGFLSTLVYSGLGGYKYLSASLLTLEKCFERPDIVFYLDTPEDVIIERLSKNTERSIYDQEEYVSLIKKRYQTVINYFPSWKIFTLTGTDEARDVDKVMEIITSLINK